MSHQWTLEDIPNAIFSAALEAGATHSDLPGGPTIDQPGPEAAHASLSHRQAKEQGLTTSGTFGRPGTGSFASVDLTSSLASRLRARLDSLGSTLFRLTWKVRVTPSGRSIFALRASALHTSGNGSGSWPTPQAFDASNDGMPRQLRFKGNAPSEAGNTRNPEMLGSYRGDLKDYVGLLAPWPTPNSTIIESKPRPPIIGNRKPTDPQIGLADVAVHLAPWPTPNAMEGGQTSRGGKRKGELLMGGLATTPGKNSNGSPAETEKPGRLNPAFPRWLMGYPPEWDDCAATATPLSHK